jgi:hypothetical protein
MSKQLTITLICDGDHDQQTIADEEHTVTLDGGRPVEFAVCTKHGVLIDDLRVLMRNGQPVAEQPRQRRGRSAGAAPLTCPMPGHEDYTAPTRSALGSHAKSKHGMTLRELDAARGGST